MPGHIPCTLVGYRVSYPDSLVEYSHKHHLRPGCVQSVLRHLESTLDLRGAPIYIVHCNRSLETGTSESYICCLAADRVSAYDAETLLAVPIPAAFTEISQRTHVESDVERLFAPSATVLESSNFKTNGWTARYRAMLWYVTPLRLRP